MLCGKLVTRANHIFHGNELHLESVFLPKFVFCFASKRSLTPSIMEDQSKTAQQTPKSAKVFAGSLQNFRWNLNPFQSTLN